MTAKSKRIRHCELYIKLAGSVWHVIQITLRVWSFIVNRRRNDSLHQGLHGGNSFNAACCTEQVSGHRLDGTHAQLVCMLAKCMFYRERFKLVIKIGGRTVSINIL